MANRKIDPEIVAHLEWIGFIRPTGLVVSAPALVHAGAILDRRDAQGQQLLRACVEERVFDPKDGPVPYVPDFRTFAESVLSWNFSPKGYAGTAANPIPVEIEVPLPDYGETLHPDLAVRELEPQNEGSKWQLLVRVLAPGEEFDSVTHGGGQLEASPHGRMERLLRQTRVRAGLLFNGRTLRLLSAPYGESSGWMDFKVADMVQTAGRPICTALRLLLGQERLLALPRHQRLTALLDDSRKFQNEVSERLAEQVLHALYELLRGFQSAHDASKGELLAAQLEQHPDEIYRGLLTVILRLVFLLYAEERDMLPEDETFIRYYSLASLYERLREDAALFPDTMDQRYGAWAQLIVLFRMVYDGAESGTLRLPKRHGALFDPDRFPFLEGRPAGVMREAQECIDPPLVPDGTIYRAFEKLLVLDGERISYRALDVEQIGSVYQTMMGFRLETATGRSVAIKADKKYGAPTTVDLEALLVEATGKREKWLQDRADRKLSDKVKQAVKGATALEDLHAALLSVIDSAATPDLVPKGAMVLQPSDERRRSGSHYTPRELTQPIVRTTLEPILARLRNADGHPSRPEQILDLKICDPAMGSGAFLVEACRQLGDALIESWHFYGETPAIPSDEDEVIFARRLVAQRCIYGVDRNPVAVDLAKVSLWLVTLAKDHPLTFLDHDLRHGDSLVGLSRKQIEAFHWNPNAPRFSEGFETMHVREHTARVTELRQQIRAADETVSDQQLRVLWSEAVQENLKVRLFGDLVLAAFFEGQNPKEREQKRIEYATAVVNGQAELYRRQLEKWRKAEQPLASFHWEIEFPEVFERERPGFDAIIGNPPFMAGSKIWPTFGASYRDLLRILREESAGRAVDLVTHFFRVSFDLLREQGTLGLVATNTISQGDTREAGLQWICEHGGEIYSATKRFRWPGQAAVIVSIVHIVKRWIPLTRLLDGRSVENITAFLFHTGSHAKPVALSVNRSKSFNGNKIYGQGFLFDDQDTQATSISIMENIVKNNPSCRERIFEYIGGEELNTDPVQSANRFVINFENFSLQKAGAWPELLEIVRSKVAPERQKLGGYSVAEGRKERWWLFGTYAAGLAKAISNLPRCLALSAVSKWHCLSFQPSNRIFSHRIVVIALSEWHAFTVLQSSPHEIWARFLQTTLGDDLCYTPSDCFETFPFPLNWETDLEIGAAGKNYYDFRAALMVKNGEGMTKTYNRFNDPTEHEPDIVKLRELHTIMDRALLHAYGWNDIQIECDFFVDFEVDDEEWGDKKRPYRYRWPDEIRDEVLARLLELNAERAKEEALSGAAAEEKNRRSLAKTSKAKQRKNQPTGMEDMFK